MQSAQILEEISKAETILSTLGRHFVELEQGAESMLLENAVASLMRLKLRVVLPAEVRK